MSDIWELDPHDVADELDESTNYMAARGEYQRAETLIAGAQMIRDLWDRDNQQ